MVAIVALASVVHFSFAPAPPPPPLTYTVGNGTPNAFFRVYVETWNGLGVGPTSVFGNHLAGAVITYTIPAPATHIRGVRVYATPWNQLGYWNSCGDTFGAGGCVNYSQPGQSTNPGGCMDGRWLRIDC